LEIFAINEMVIERLIFTEVANLETFEREMGEVYDYWFYTEEEAIAHLKEENV